MIPNSTSELPAFLQQLVQTALRDNHTFHRSRRPSGNNSFKPGTTLSPISFTNSAPATSAPKSRSRTGGNKLASGEWEEYQEYFRVEERKSLYPHHECLNGVKWPVAV